MATIGTPANPPPRTCAKPAAGWNRGCGSPPRRGQGEYDSPSYMGYYFLSMSYLAAWAKDPAMKKRAAMMLDYLIADYAAENLDGIYVGAHSRVSTIARCSKSGRTSRAISDGCCSASAIRSQPPASYILFYVLASAYEPPEILQHIATDRSQPYTHYELKRTRNRWRFFDELHGPVYKTTYVRREYAVGSDQGGTLQPIQEHSWDVTWSVPDPRGVQNTLFTLNPHSSLHELETYFTFPPDIGISGVVSSKKSYDSPDKFVGGSPYEKIFQDQDAVDRAVRHPARQPLSAHQRLLLEGPGRRARRSLRLDLRARRRRLDCLPAAAAVHLEADRGRRQAPLQPVPEERNRRAGGGGSEFPMWKRSARRFWRCRWSSLDPTPSVRFRSLRGTTLEFTYGQTPRVSGAALDYAHWPLFGGPFVEAAVDSEQMTLKYGNMRRMLDFRRLTVTDSRN